MHGACSESDRRHSDILYDLEKPTVFLMKLKLKELTSLENIFHLCISIKLKLKKIHEKDFNSSCSVPSHCDEIYFELYRCFINYTLYVALEIEVQ